MDRLDVPPFPEVVRLYRGSIVCMLTRLGVRSCDLADAAQEVLIAIARGLPHFDPGLASDPATALPRWIFGICLRVSKHQGRLASRRARELLCEAAELDNHAAPAPAADVELQGAEDVALLDRLLALLDPYRRAVVVAHDVEGLTMGTVAAALGVPVSTAWNLRRVGLDELRAALRRDRSR